MKFIRWLSFIILFVCSPLFGQECPNGDCGSVYSQPIYGQPVYGQPTYQQENVLQTTWNDPKMVQVMGTEGTIESGYFVSVDGNTGYIFTATHALQGIGEKVTVSTGDGRKHPGTVVQFDAEGDAAVILLDGGVQSRQAFELASTEPEVGAAVFFQGFGMGTLRSQQMVVSKYDDTLGYASGKPIQGDSGGPVVDRYGRVVGCISGQPGGPAVYPRLPRLHMLIAKILGRGQYVPVQPVPGPGPVSPPVQPVPGPKPPSDIPAYDIAGRVLALEAEVKALRTEKQDKGDYVLRGDLSIYAQAKDVTGVVSSVENLKEAVKERPTTSVLQEAVATGNNGVLAQIRKDAEETNGRIKTEVVGEVTGLLGRSKDTALTAAKTAAVSAAKTAIQSQLTKLGLLAAIPGGAGVALGLTALTWLYRLKKAKSGPGVQTTQTFR